MDILVQPVAWVRNARTVPSDDHWAPVIATIELDDRMPTEALDGIEQFSHLEIIYHFDRAREEQMVFAGHPRENPDYPRMGIFAQRKKDRPNRIGLATVLLLVREERILKVQYLDAIDGTPVLDIKPVFREFEPKGAIVQPEWSSELMRHYW